MTIFKNDWEKTEEVYKLPIHIIENIITQAFPETNYSYQSIPGGCSNINIKLNLEGSNNPYLLRIYIHNKQAMYKEKNISKLLKNNIPIPVFFHSGICDGYHFAINNYISGITLRELLLKNNTNNIDDIMYQVGKILSIITSIKFKNNGFFDKDLNISEETNKDNIITFFKNSLNS